MLHHPRPDVKTSITVDASDSAIGAQLEQLQKGRWVPLAVFSRKLSATEKKCAFDRELLSAYQAVNTFAITLKLNLLHCTPTINRSPTP